MVMVVHTMYGKQFAFYASNLLVTFCITSYLTHLDLYESVRIACTV